MNDRYKKRPDIDKLLADRTDNYETHSTMREPKGNPPDDFDVIPESYQELFLTKIDKW